MDWGNGWIAVVGTWRGMRIYLNLCKSDHSAGGITFESAKAKGFVEDPSWESPAI